MASDKSEAFLFIFVYCIAVVFWTCRLEDIVVWNKTAKQWTFPMV